MRIFVLNNSVLNNFNSKATSLILLVFSKGFWIEITQFYEINDPEGGHMFIEKCCKPNLPQLRNADQRSAFLSWGLVLLCISFSIIMSSILDFRNFCKKPDSIFNSSCLYLKSKINFKMSRVFLK